MVCTFEEYINEKFNYKKQRSTISFDDLNVGDKFYIGADMTRGPEIETNSIINILEKGLIITWDNNKQRKMNCLVYYTDKPIFLINRYTYYEIASTDNELLMDFMKSKYYEDFKKDDYFHKTHHRDYYGEYFDKFLNNSHIK